MFVSHRTIEETWAKHQIVKAADPLTGPVEIGMFPNGSLIPPKISPAQLLSIAKNSTWGRGAYRRLLSEKLGVAGQTQPNAGGPEPGLKEEARRRQAGSQIVGGLDEVVGNPGPKQVCGGDGALLWPVFVRMFRAAKQRAGQGGLEYETRELIER
jgi:hypothetical protein